MANRTRSIINGVLPILCVLAVLGVLTVPDLAGMITSDGSYKSPASDRSYGSPKTGPGYTTTRSDNSYESPAAGPGYIPPKIDNWTRPMTGSGFQRPNTIDYNPENAAKPIEEAANQTNRDPTIEENQTIAIPAILPNQTADNQAPVANESIYSSNLTNPAIIPGNDSENKEDFLPQWKFVGKWRAITVLVSYADGEWEYVDPPTDLLDMKNEHEWEMGAQKGRWQVQKIEEADWQRWQVRKYAPTTKLVFGEPDGRITDGPLESEGIWMIYDTDNGDGRGMRNIQAQFRSAIAQSDYLFTVDKIGAGLVRSLDKKIDCGPVCIKNYKVDQMVTLVATPDDGWTFSKWSGDCIGTDNVCRVVVQGPTVAAAEFKGSCRDNEGCPQDQACIDSNCVQLECKCGTVKEHICNKYECCFDSDCGGGNKCSIEARKCVAASSCKEIRLNGGSAKKHDLVFVGADFKDYEDLEKAVKILLDYEGNFQTKLGVFSLTPFKENLGRFNFWMVLAPDYPHYGVESPIKGVGPDTLYLPDEAYYGQFVQNCERDTVVVISPYLFRSFAKFPTMGGSGGLVYLSLQNPLKGPEYLGRTLAHELGHAIGGLADEYVEYGAADLTQTGNYPNCAPDLKEAQRKWGGLVGAGGVHYYTGIAGITGTTYYRSLKPTFPELGLFPDGSDWGDGGCSYVHKNIRPTQNSIMRSNYDLGNDFGPVNERVLDEKLKGYDPQVQQVLEPMGGRGRRFIEDQG